MAKLIYKTKEPKKGFVFNESFMTHENKTYLDPLPTVDVQNEAMKIVSDTIEVLARKLDRIGYDPTRIRFSIYCK